MPWRWNRRIREREGRDPERGQPALGIGHAGWDSRRCCACRTTHSAGICRFSLVDGISLSINLLSARRTSPSRLVVILAIVNGTRRAFSRGEKSDSFQMKRSASKIP